MLRILFLFGVANDYWSKPFSIFNFFIDLILLFDIHVEHEVLCNKNDHDNELLELYQVNSKDELQRNVVARMKSLTNASDEVCVSILERNAYNLNTSIETYLASSK